MDKKELSQTMRQEAGRTFAFLGLKHPLAAAGDVAERLAGLSRKAEDVGLEAKIPEKLLSPEKVAFPSASAVGNAVPFIEINMDFVIDGRPRPGTLPRLAATEGFMDTMAFVKDGVCHARLHFPLDQHPMASNGVLKLVSLRDVLQRRLEAFAGDVCMAGAAISDFLAAALCTVSEVAATADADVAKTDAESAWHTRGPDGGSVSLSVPFERGKTEALARMAADIARDFRIKASPTRDAVSLVRGSFMKDFSK